MSTRTSEAWLTDLPNRHARVLAVMGVVTLMIAVGVLLTVRRLSGAFTVDLPQSSLFLTALFSAGIAASARMVWRKLFPLDLDNLNSTSWRDQFVGWGSSLVLLLMMVGTCFPGASTSDWLIWLPLLAVDQFWRQDFFDGGHPEYQAGISTLAASREETKLLETTSSNSHSSELAPANCSQQVFRVREPDGQEAIYATLQVDFQAGQRYATAYIGFCPPLVYRPEIEADPYDGPRAEVKIVQALAHGARIDLKLAAAAECPSQVFIDLAARCPNSV